MSVQRPKVVHFGEITKFLESPAMIWRRTLLPLQRKHNV